MCNDIVCDVLDETRKERKISMVIDDVGVDEYVNTDITEMNIIKSAHDPSIDSDLKYACE